MGNKNVALLQLDKDVEVCLYVENEEILKIGEKMNANNEEAYMNGYNWEAFIQYYLSKHEPKLLEGMKTDPEAGMYVAYYENTPENELKAKRLMELLCSLLENEEELCRIVREEGDEIEWD